MQSLVKLFQLAKRIGIVINFPVVIRLVVRAGNRQLYYFYCASRRELIDLARMDDPDDGQELLLGVV